VDPRVLFEALADPVRFRIVEALRKGPRYVSDLVAELGESQPNVSRHLKALRESGLVGSSREGKWVRYAVVPSALDLLARWAASGPSAAAARPEPRMKANPGPEMAALAARRARDAEDPIL
jgi:DNA-binding transcriptional ArsR family regulator